MKPLVTVLHELIGLFIDDGLLALEIVAVVVLTGVFANLFPIAPSLAEGVLLFGCLGVLLANVSRAARR